MSKSLGNVVRPARHAGALRHGRVPLSTCCATWPSASDADFSEDGLVTRLNADLANGLGNLASRVLAMQQRYFAGRASSRSTPEPADLALCATRSRGAPRARRSTSPSSPSIAGSRRSGGRSTTPTSTSPRRRRSASRRTPGSGRAWAPSCTSCARSLRVTAQLVEPFLPETSRKLCDSARLSGGRPRPTSTCPGEAAFRPATGPSPRKPLFPRVEAPNRQGPGRNGAACGNPPLCFPLENDFQNRYGSDERLIDDSLSSAAELPNERSSTRASRRLHARQDRRAAVTARAPIAAPAATRAPAAGPRRAPAASSKSPSVGLRYAESGQRLPLW